MNLKIYYHINQDRAGIPMDYTGARHFVVPEGESVARMRLASVLWTLLEVFPSVLLVMVLGGAAVASAQGLLTLGEVVAFVTLLLSLAWPVGSLGFLLSFMREAQTAADRVCEVFECGAVLNPRNLVA